MSKYDVRIRSVQFIPLKEVNFYECILAISIQRPFLRFHSLFGLSNQFFFSLSLSILEQLSGRKEHRNTILAELASFQAHIYSTG